MLAERVKGNKTQAPGESDAQTPAERRGARTRVQRLKRVFNMRI